MTGLPLSLAIPGLLGEKSLHALLGVLTNGGAQARVVGGAVRNTLLGLPVSDIDICTDLLPEAVMARVRLAGFDAVPTGIKHGTVTVVIGRRTYEVTTLREDVETDGRHAKVQFGTSFETDALRRDFTINALSVSADGTVHDYTDGIADLVARRVRFIGDADQRIREDYLRILRLFRFSAEYGRGTVEADGLAAAVRGRGGLERLSRERVGQEMGKLLIAPHAAGVVAMMAVNGFFDAVLGGPADADRFAALTAIEVAQRFSADKMRRLAALALFAKGDAARLKERLRLSNAQTERLTGLVAPPSLAGQDEAAAREALFRLGAKAYRDGVLLDWAASGAAPDDAVRAALLALPLRWTPPEFHITGNDLVAAGVESGPGIGRALRRIRSKWISAGMPADAAAQRALLAEMLQAS